MMRIPTLFTICFYVVTAHLPVHAMDSEHGGIQNDYKSHPDYVFAKHFLQFIGKKIGESENGSIPLETRGAAYMLHHLRAVETNESFGIDAASLTGWLLQLPQEKLDATTTENIKKRINQILNREPFTDEQVQTILIAFLDTYDDNFEALDYQQKISFSLRSLVLRLMKICNSPASISQRLGMALLGSRYPLPLSATVFTEMGALTVSYMMGFIVAIPIVILNGGSLGAVMGYSTIGSFAGTGLYNGFQWFRFKREEDKLLNAMSTAPVGQYDGKEVLLEEEEEEIEDDE